MAVWTNWSYKKGVKLEDLGYVLGCGQKNGHGTNVGVLSLKFSYASRSAGCKSGHFPSPLVSGLAVCLATSVQTANEQLRPDGPTPNMQIKDLSKSGMSATLVEGPFGFPNISIAPGEKRMLFLVHLRVSLGCMDELFENTPSGYSGLWADPKGSGKPAQFGGLRQTLNRQLARGKGLSVS